MNMSRMTPLCGNLHRAVAAGRLWTEIAADLRRSRGRFRYRDSLSIANPHPRYSPSRTRPPVSSRTQPRNDLPRLTCDILPSSRPSRLAMSLPGMYFP